MINKVINKSNFSINDLCLGQQGKGLADVFLGNGWISSEGK